MFWGSLKFLAELLSFLVELGLNCLEEAFQ